jgi:hypothetical protein
MCVAHIRILLIRESARDGVEAIFLGIENA